MIATVEKVAAKLPPSERDFQVFRFVRVETNSTRAAAQVLRFRRPACGRWCRG